MFGLASLEDAFAGSLTACGKSPDAASRLISSLLSLKDGASVPPKLVKEASSRQVARSLVARLARSGRAPVSTSGERSFLDGSRIYLHLDEDTVPKVLQSGFKNAHQTKVSGGGATTAEEQRLRAAFEDEILGVRLERRYVPGRTNPAHTIRPKYAYLRWPRRDGSFRKSASGSQYGSVIAVLREDVKEEATWTRADSIFAKAAVNELPRTFLQGSDRKPRVAWPGDEFEVQLFGEKGARDVAHWLVPGNARTQTVASLKRSGAPVFQYREEFVQTGTRRYHAAGGWHTKQKGYYRIVIDKEL